MESRVTTSNSKKVSHAAGYAIIILLLVAGTAFLLNGRIGGIQVYDVYPTPSMRPTLEVGDLVVVDAVQYSSIHVGDVIVFARPSFSGGCGTEIVVHRVVNVTSEGLITQGDNRATNSVPDEGPPANEWPPVPPECVKGLVVVALPFLGRISEAFPPPLNYILVAAIILLIFMAELFTGHKDEEEEVPEGTNGEAPPPTLQALRRTEAGYAARLTRASPTKSSPGS
ncbi:MAG: signal peptidase I [Nitrososphaerales archaeon]|jgi:signal peptidase I